MKIPKEIYILTGILILLVIYPQQSEPKKETKIIYINDASQRPTFDITKAGEKIYPAHPFIGWILFIIIVIFIYFIIHRLFNTFWKH